jgi:hypothetical protein
LIALADIEKPMRRADVTSFGHPEALRQARRSAQRRKAKPS